MLCWISLWRPYASSLVFRDDSVHYGKWQWTAAEAYMRQPTRPKKQAARSFLPTACAIDDLTGSYGSTPLYWFETMMSSKYVVVLAASFQR